jgi:hypothetical protein
VFITQLPPESAYVRSLVGGDAGIPLATQIAAMTVDALHLGIWLELAPKTRGPQPTPVLGALMGLEPHQSSRSRMSPEQLLARLREQQPETEV